MIETLELRQFLSAAPAIAVADAAPKHLVAAETEPPAATTAPDAGGLGGRLAGRAMILPVRVLGSGKIAGK
jgi:hypothetical protein